MSRSGSHKPRPSAAKRPGGAQQRTKGGAAAGKAGASSGSKAGAGPTPASAAKPDAKGAAKGAKSSTTGPTKGAAKGSAKGTGPRAASARPGLQARAREAVSVPGRETWATTTSLPMILATCAGLLLLGLLVGVGGAFVHYMRVSVGGAALPTGTLLAVLAAAGVAFSAGVLLRSRLGAVVPSLGWLISGVLLSSPKAEGDLLIGGAALDYGFLVGGLAVLLAMCGLPYALLNDRAERAGPPPEPDPAA